MFAIHTIRYGLFNITVFMKRLGKSDWYIAGFTILEAEGFSKITIENLCSSLKITKGSFYHHFGNIDGYIMALMKHWLQVNTIDYINKADACEEGVSKIEKLNDMVMQSSYKMEQVIRAWSYSDPVVKEYIDQADTIRLEYLTLLKEQEGMDTQTAKDAAILEYAILIGMQQLCPDISKEQLMAIYKLYKL